MIEIKFSNDDESIHNILALQFQNLRSNLNQDEIKSQGFVYVQHTFDSLKGICEAEPAVVAYDQTELAGYALCMIKAHSKNVPELMHFFESLDHVMYNEKSLRDIPFIACGQICVAKAYRGKNLMRDLYHQMKKLNSKYQYCITEVSSQNVRSLHAHFNVGFVSIHSHLNEHGEEWQILLWDWNK